MTDHWLKTALTNDVTVADLLLHLKHSSDSDSKSVILPPRWGHRKHRSKSFTPTAAAVTNLGKENRGSPTTHLSWSGGGGSSSDGYDDSCRRKDLVKVNEGASTSNYHKFEKRKIYKNEQELTSMRVSLNPQLSNCENLKRIKIDVDQNQGNKTTIIEKHDRQLKLPSLTQSCRVEAETKMPQKGFVLPDLNMMPSEDDMLMMS